MAEPPHDKQSFQDFNIQLDKKYRQDADRLADNIVPQKPQNLQAPPSTASENTRKKIIADKIAANTYIPNKVPAPAPKYSPLPEKHRKRIKNMAHQARLDLHGDTQEVALQKVRGFVAESYRLNRRKIIIITGKGQGVLQQALPLWLDTHCADKIIEHGFSSKTEGGQGARYVALAQPKTQPNSKKD